MRFVLLLLKTPQVIKELIENNSYQIFYKEDCILTMRRIDGQVYGISKYREIPYENSQKQIVEKIKKHITDNKIVILSSDRNPDSRINLFLENQGLEIARRKALFEKELDANDSDKLLTFQYRAEPDISQDEFIDIFDRITLSDKERTGSARMFLTEIREMAGASYKPQNWLIAYQHDLPIGMILLQIMEEDTTEGLIFYIGVLPEYQGKGLGTVLHAEGQTMLTKLGCHLYIGSTDTDNTPMMAVFAKNKCEQKYTQYFYEPRS
jgi:RimJ/RimL family protein N-acetyltransferase